MLALTQNAVEAVEDIVRQYDAPEGAILRITKPGLSLEDRLDRDDLELSVVAAPDPDDVRVEGIPISVDPEALAFLDDKVLDAEVADGGVHFRLYEQPEEDDAAQVLSSRNGDTPDAGPKDPPV